MRLAISRSAISGGDSNEPGCPLVLKIVMLNAIIAARIAAVPIAA